MPFSRRSISGAHQVRGRSPGQGRGQPEEAEVARVADDEADEVRVVPATLDVAVGDQARLDEQVAVLVGRDQQRPTADVRLGRRDGRDVPV
jgi:hypothetical protein